MPQSFRNTGVGLEQALVVDGGAAQGSTTAGQTGQLIQGAVTTNPPAYTTGQTNPVSLDPNGNVRVNMPSLLVPANSSATPLGSAAVFTGTSTSTLGYGCISVTSISNVASGTDGLAIQQSTDSTNWDIVDAYTAGAGANVNVIIPVKAAFFRVVYTNAAGAQASFRLQSILKPQMPTASAVRPADGLSVQNDFAEVLSADLVFNGTSLDLMRSVANGTNSIGTGILAAGLVAQFDDATITAITENSFGNVRMSADHVLYAAQAPTASAGTAITPNPTTVAAGSLVIKGSAGNLYGLNVTTGGSAGYVMLFNATSAPADGTVTPIKTYVVAANATIEQGWSPPLRFSTGITAVFSTTGPFTKTISATAFISGDFL